MEAVGGETEANPHTDTSTIPTVPSMYLYGVLRFSVSNIRQIMENVTPLWDQYLIKNVTLLPSISPNN